MAPPSLPWRNKSPERDDALARRVRVAVCATAPPPSAAPAPARRYNCSAHNRLRRCYGRIAGLTSHSTEMPSMFHLRTGRCAMAMAFALLGLAASAADAADFYAGKSIDLLIGAPPAGGYDIYARTVARHLGRHIPGQPAIVAKNMPGAGSARAAGFISTVAPRDGTVIAGIKPGAIMGPLLDPKAEVLFEPTKVLYLGTANNGTRVCVTRKDSGIRTFDDVLTQKAVFGGVSTNDSTRDYGFMHKKTSGAIYSLVTGYRGTADIGLAMERGEVDGACGWDWASFKSQKPDWIRDGKVNII